MNSHNLLGLLIPTNEPDTAFKLFLPTLKNFVGISEYVTIQFNFQEPWTTNQIHEAVKICEDLGFYVKYSINKYEIPGKGLIPFNQIRYDSCSEDCLFYVLMDDDFSFLDVDENKLSSRSYLEALHYLCYHDRCGAIMMKGNTRSSHLHEITPILSFNCQCITDKGIILRKIPGGIVVPDDALLLYGSDEEKIALSWRIYEGYYPAVMTHISIHHYENDAKNGGPVQAGRDMYNWNTRSIKANNVNRYIKDHFLPDFHNGGALSTQLGDTNQYLKSGGILDESVFSYENISTEEIINDINKFTRVQL